MKKELFDHFYSQIKNFPPIRGIIHIGAHIGQEFPFYKNLNVPILFFEPLSANFKSLTENVSKEENVYLFNLALGNENKKIEMFIASNMQSSSILKPTLHLELHPDITFNTTEEVKMVRLNDLDLSAYPDLKDLSNFNFLCIDVQGYEIEVFKGASEQLAHLDFIITEINKQALYENGANIEDLDELLASYNFQQVTSKFNLSNGVWGDALYIRKSLLG